MAHKIITSFFTNSGAPETGLNPLITIRELHDTIPGSYITVVNGDPMVEVVGGWYRYDFATYDYKKSYVMTADGGGSLSLSERYQPAANDSFQEEIQKEVWTANAVDYLDLGTMGQFMNLNRADIQQIRIDVVSAVALLQTLLKYSENRTRIDKIAKTLTIYENDGTTALKVFDLKDSTGSPSVVEVCERSPI